MMQRLRNILKGVLGKESRKYPIHDISMIDLDVNRFNKVFPSCENNALKVYIDSWSFGDSDHCYILEPVADQYVSQTKCENCDTEMHIITEVFTLDGLAGLKTGICSECYYITHVRNLSSNWYSNHFRYEWLKGDCEREGNVSLKMDPAKLVNGYVEKKFPKVLDIGCGLGDRLLGFKRLGYKVFGCEPSQRRAEIASQKLGVPIHCGNAEDFLDKCDNKYDCVYLYCVLAFLENPFTVLRKAIERLDHGGVLYIKDGNYIQHNLFHNAHLGVMRSFFSVDTFKVFAKKNSLEILHSKENESEYIFRKTANIERLANTKAQSIGKYLNDYYLSELNIKRIAALSNKGLNIRYGPFSRSVSYGISGSGLTNQLNESAVELPIKFIHINAKTPPVLLK